MLKFNIINVICLINVIIMFNKSNTCYMFNECYNMLHVICLMNVIICLINTIANSPIRNVLLRNEVYRIFNGR